MNDIEKEFKSAIREHGASGNEAASACYEIHRRETMEMLETFLMDLNPGTKATKMILAKLRELKG